ncbi:XRE family transcriptional regulator [Saccharothrix obliqua]|uniref:XRE family transcriptional regulator n=1 Tax=Saccharothrix obliqua TaxID=2861747 RepID=UPI001C604917|nr:XRE family transcriptional regulator [Saccharothrix obliqua]MBW4720477.1 XRE family transcriptional regulator [Saccharothrix obliqua]
MRHEARVSAGDRPAAAPPGDLAQALRYGPFSRALAAAIRRRGLSLSRLSAHLRSQDIAIAQSTLSYWQRGLRHPAVPRALDAVRALERVLQVPDDSLVTLIGPHQRAPEPDQRVRSIPELSQSWARTGALLEEFDGVSGSPCNSDVHVVMAIDDVRFGPIGEITEMSSTMVVRARRSGPDGFVVIHQSEPGADIESARITAGDGCRVGRVRRQPVSAGMVTELLFDRKLTEGDVHSFSFSMACTAPVRSPTFYRVIRGWTQTYLLRLHFDPAMRPVRCTRVERAREGAVPTASEPLLCGSDGFASAYFEGLEPSLAGVDFLWE